MTAEQLAARLVEATVEKREIAAREKVLAAEIAELEERVLEAFEAGEIAKITVSGYTVSPRTEYWPKNVGDRHDAVAALEESGFDEYVFKTYNYQSLRGRMSEMMRNGEEFPPEWDNRLTVNTRMRCNVRRAS